MSNQINFETLNTSFLQPNFEEQKTINLHIGGERSILFGKIGRTWTGFFWDWLATLGLISDPQLKDKSFSQRWTHLSSCHYSQASLSKGYVESAYFIQKIKNIKDDITSVLNDIDQFLNDVNPFEINSKIKNSDLIQTDKLQILKWIQANQLKIELKIELDKDVATFDLEKITRQIHNFISIKKAYKTAEEILRPIIKVLSKRTPDTRPFPSIRASKTELEHNCLWYRMSAIKTALALELNKPPGEINFEKCSNLIEEFNKNIKNHEALTKQRLDYQSKGYAKARDILIEISKKIKQRPARKSQRENTPNHRPENRPEEAKIESNVGQTNEIGTKIEFKRTDYRHSNSSETPIPTETIISRPPPPFLNQIKRAEIEVGGEGEDSRENSEAKNMTIEERIKRNQMEAKGTQKKKT